MSAPAAKAFSLPVMTIAPTVSSSSNASSAAATSATSPAFSALSALGRLSVMSPTAPRLSTMMFSYGIADRSPGTVRVLVAVHSRGLGPTIGTARLPSAGCEEEADQPDPLLVPYLDTEGLVAATEEQHIEAARSHRLPTQFG